MDVSAEGRHEEDRQGEGEVNKSREDLRERLTQMRREQNEKKRK